MTTCVGGGIFLAGYDPAGKYLWAKATGGSGDYGAAVDIDASGHLAVSGRTSNAIDFGAWPQDPWLSGYGSANFFVASFTLSGNLPPTYQWTKIPGSGTNGSSAGQGVALDPSGRVLAAGSFQQTIDLGGKFITTPVGTDGGFVSQYSQ